MISYEGLEKALKDKGVGKQTFLYSLDCLLELLQRLEEEKSFLGEV